MGMICFRSQFSCQIGGKIFMQSSSLGFSVKCNENESKNLPSLESAANAHPVPPVTEHVVQNISKSTLNQSHDTPDKRCNSKPQRK